MAILQVIVLIAKAEVEMSNTRCFRLRYASERRLAA